MADIINLRTQRKRKVRAEKDQKAEANRVKHGTPKNLLKTTEAKRQKETRDLDGKKLD